MALSRLKTWSVGEILTAADLNGEINNILQNALSLVSPLTANIDFNNFQALNFALQASTLAGLPAAGTAGRLARVTDSHRGPAMDTGFLWLALRGGVFDLRERATAGAGTSASPYTGWDTNLVTDIPTTGGVIFIPPNTVFSYASTLAFANRELLIIGSGRTSILRYTPANGTDAMTFTNNAIMASLRSFKLEGAGFAQLGTGDGIQLTGGALKAHLSDLWIEGFGGGAGLKLFDGVQDSLFSNVHVRSSNVGIHVHNAIGGGAGANNNNAFIMATTELNRDFGILLQGANEGNVFYAPLIQSSVNGGYEDRGGSQNRLDHPWIENNNTGAGAFFNVLLSSAAQGASITYGHIGSPASGTVSLRIDSGVLDSEVRRVQFTDANTNIQNVGTRTIIEDNILSGTISDTGTNTLGRQGRSHAGVVGISGTNTKANNLRGDFQIATTSTSATVTFGTAEPNASYNVVVTPTTNTGPPAAGANRVKEISKLAGSFTVTVEAAPGAGATQNFDWILVR